MQTNRWWSCCLVALGLLLLVAPRTVRAVEEPAGDSTRVFQCLTEPGPNERIYRGFNVQGGGMSGTGWDGSGTNATTLNWHMRNTSTDFATSGQRAAWIAGLQTWANVVQITFVELPVTGQNRSLDLGYTTGSHCGYEPAECGNSNCPFDGAGGVLAHAGFPPAVNSLCVPNMPETYAGDVHFDDAETWEQNTGSASAMSLQLIATHEIGHGLGLQHDTGSNDIMRPTFSLADSAIAPSASDLANIRAGYASGTGSVITLESLGVWVNNAYGGTELGTFSNPFNTVSEGVAGVPPGSTAVTLHIRGGNYSGGITITQPMFVQVESGPAYLGAP